MFSLLQKVIVEESNKVSDLKYFGFFHQVVDLTLSTNQIKDQMWLI